MAVTVALLGSGLVLLPLAAAPDDGVGVVAEYSPTSAHFIFTRKGASPATIPVRIGTIVRAGDEVVLPANGSVTLSRADGPPRRIEGPGTFQVPPAADLGVAGQLIERIASVFDPHYRTAATASSRGSDCDSAPAETTIAVPIVRAKASIVAGTRDLTLAWVGGCAPYTAALLQDQMVVAHEDGLLRAQVTFERVSLVAGKTYTVSISDFREVTKRVGFTALAAAPAPPANLAGAANDLGVVARALWLADQDGGAWRLDSLEMLRPAVAKRDPLALRVQDVLLTSDAASLLDPKH